MKNRKLLVIIILINITFGLYVLLKDNNIEKNFKARIIEIYTNSSLVVEPNENEKIRKSADKISVIYNSNTTWEIGMEVIVTYKGEIMETSPVQINTTGIYTYDLYKVYDNLYTIVHIITLILFIIVILHLDNFMGFKIKNKKVLILIFIVFVIFTTWIFLYDVVDIPKVFLK